MKPRKEDIVGFSLAACLQTSSRIIGPVGFGELGLIAFIGFSILIFIFANPKTPASKKSYFPFIFLAYLLIFLLPSTAITAITADWKYVHEGDGWRDFTAYCLSGLLIFVLSIQKISYGRIVHSFCFFLFFFHKVKLLVVRL